MLDNVAGYLARGGDRPTARESSATCSATGETVQNGLGQAAGLGAAKAGMLLSLLAPLVMAALGRAKREKGLDAGGLAGVLGGEQQHPADAHRA